MKNRLFRALALGLALSAGACLAQTVSMGGSLGDKALLVIDGKPATLAVGATARGVKLLAVNGSEARVEVGGKPATLVLGAAQVNLGAASPGGGSGTRVVLSAGSGGHFIGQGSINGQSVSFLVDTGATNVSLSRSEAQRLGIDYRKGEHGMSNTANGMVEVHHVKLSSVRLGEVQVYDVDATIVPAAMQFVLLGNSFLSRFQMRRDNDTMVLEKRF